MKLSRFFIIALLLPAFGGCATEEAGGETGNLAASGMPAVATPAATDAEDIAEIPHPSGARQVGVRLTEYKVDLTTDSVPAGSVEFQILNAGRTTHALIVRNGTLDVYSLSRHLSPGDTTVMTVDLVPGEYDYICPIRDEFDHYSEGMRGHITVF